MGDENRSRDNTPVSFVNARVCDSKSGGSKYIWSKTFDLDEVKRTMGTGIVTLKVTIPKNRKNVQPEDRLIIFSPSESKYLPKSRDGGNYKPGPSSSGNDDVLL